MPNKKTLDRLADQKDSFIDNSETDLLGDFDSIERAIYNDVMKKILSMNQQDGKVVFDDKNIMSVNELTAIIIAAIQKSKYPSNVNKYLRNFDQVGKYSAQIQSTVNEVPVKDLEKLISPIQKEMVSNVMESLTGQGVDVAFIKPLTEGIYRNIVSGSTIADIQKSLEQTIISDERKLGAFKRYVVQMSRDAMLQYEGQINSRIANEYGLDAYMYIGTIIKDSRPQCIRWLGKKYITKRELDSEIAWAYNSGMGMIPGTTKENFAIYRGGYNCRHTAVPFKLSASIKKQYGLD